MGLVEKGTLSKPALKPLTWLLNYSRKYSLWMFQWGLACCAIEMGAALASPRYDMMRLGVIPFPGQPAPGRPHLRVGHGHRQDGARGPAALRADARPEVRDLDGLVRQLRRSLLGLVLGHQGHRPDHPRRRLRPGLPAAARGALQGIVLLQERIQNEGIGNDELEQRWRGEPIVVELT